MSKIIRSIALAVLALLVLSTAAFCQSPSSDNGYEKKSYNYSEWAKGRFSEVVTVRNAGKVIYLGGIEQAGLSFAGAKLLLAKRLHGGCTH